MPETDKRKVDMQVMGAAEYNKAWVTRDDMKLYGPFSRILRRIILKLVRPLSFTSVLDVGCGQGSLLKELYSEHPKIEVHGTDFSKKAIEMASARVPNGQFQFLDLSKRHLDETFDLVICSEVLEHIIDDQAAIRNLVSMTKNYLVVSAPQGRMRSFELSVGHVRNYEYGELVKKLEKHGLHIVRVVEWGFPFYSPLYRSFLNGIKGKGTTGKIGPFRKVISLGIYGLFKLCSWKHGDEIVILAEPIRSKQIEPEK